MRPSRPATSQAVKSELSATGVPSEADCSLPFVPSHRPAEGLDADGFESTSRCCRVPSAAATPQGRPGSSPQVLWQARCTSESHTAGRAWGLRLARCADAHGCLANCCTPYISHKCLCRAAGERGACAFQAEEGIAPKEIRSRAPARVSIQGARYRAFAWLKKFAHPATLVPSNCAIKHAIQQNMHDIPAAPTSRHPPPPAGLAARPRHCLYPELFRCR